MNETTPSLSAAEFAEETDNDLALASPNVCQFAEAYADRASAADKATIARLKGERDELFDYRSSVEAKILRHYDSLVSVGKIIQEKEQAEASLAALREWEEKMRLALECCDKAMFGDETAPTLDEAKRQVRAALGGEGTPNQKEAK